MVRKILLSLIAVLGLCVYGFAQNRQVSGKVADAEGKPVAGATVMVDGTSTGTTTGTDGKFTIAAPADATLAVSFIGYETRKVAVAGKTHVEVVMHEDAQAIENVVVTAFGTTTKKDLTGSIATIRGEELAKRQVSTVSKMLEGAVPGVQLTTATNQPGTDAAIYVRGVGSLNAGTGALIGVGVTLPGTYDPARRVLDYAPAIGVFGPVEIGPWMDGMTQKFGVPVYVENDTNAQCMGEHELCRARDLVYVSAGTGVGAGVMLDGRLRRGETNKCGEIGYNVFFEDYKRTARAAGCLEQRIGYHVLEQQFALDRFSRRSQIPPALLAQMAAQVTKPLALCIANLTHVLDCSTVVLGGEVAELLGDALLDALNARLEELCLSPVRVRRPASADDGLIGMAAHITRMEVDALLEEE